MKRKSLLGHGAYILIFAKRTVNCCHPLKFVKLAAPLDIRAGNPTRKQLAVQTRTLFQYIQIRLSHLSHGGPHHVRVSFRASPTPYDKQLVFHRVSLSGNHTKLLSNAFSVLLSQFGLFGKALSREFVSGGESRVDLLDSLKNWLFFDLERYVDRFLKKD